MICSVRKAMLAVKAKTLPQKETSWLLKETLCPQNTLKEVVDWKLKWLACCLQHAIPYWKPHTAGQGYFIHSHCRVALLTIAP